MGHILKSSWKSSLKLLLATFCRKQTNNERMNDWMNEWIHKYISCMAYALKYGISSKFKKEAIQQWIQTLQCSQTFTHIYIYILGAQLIQKLRSSLKLLGVRWVTWSKFHTEDPRTLGTTIQNLVTMTTLTTGFVHPWYICPLPIPLKPQPNLKSSNRLGTEQNELTKTITTRESCCTWPCVIMTISKRWEAALQTAVSQNEICQCTAERDHNQYDRHHHTDKVSRRQHCFPGTWVTNCFKLISWLHNQIWSKHSLWFNHY